MRTSPCARGPQRRVDLVPLHDRIADPLAGDAGLRHVAVDAGDFDRSLDVLQATGNALVDLLVDAEGRPFAEVVATAAVDPHLPRVEIDPFDLAAGDLEAPLLTGVFLRPQALVDRCEFSDARRAGVFILHSVRADLLVLGLQLLDLRLAVVNVLFLLGDSLFLARLGVLAIRLGLLLSLRVSVDHALVFAAQGKNLLIEVDRLGVEGGPVLLQSVEFLADALQRGGDGRHRQLAGGDPRHQRPQLADHRILTLGVGLPDLVGVRITKELPQAL